MESESADLSLIEKFFGPPGLAPDGVPLASHWLLPPGSPCALVALATAACGIASGVLSGIGIIARSERLLLVCLTLLCDPHADR